MRKTIIACAIVALVAGASTATAAQLITGKQIQNGSITGKDIATGSIKKQKLSPAVRRQLAKQGAAGPQGPAGPAGPAGPKGEPGNAAGLPTAGNWGIINRNTIGSPGIQLRSGPVAGAGAAPLGNGSLNVLVGDGGAAPPTTADLEKAAFGNEVDFAGDDFLGVDAVGFRVFTTGENVTAGGASANMPSITFEVDPNRAASASNYSSLVFTPANSSANQWSPYIDATTTGLWGGTGGAFTGSPCDLNGARCSFADLKAYLSDGGDPPRIFSAAVAKGRDFRWQGAVDGLRINGTVYDFEEHGVTERTP